MAKAPVVENTGVNRMVVHDDTSVEIAFVGGWGRSGSTLLARILSEVPGFVAVGEVRDVFLRGIVQNRVCGCGVRFSQCDFWQAVGDEAFGGWKTLSVSHLERLRKQTDKPWHVPALINPGFRARTDQAVAEYGEILLPLYQTIRRITGAQVIVDASKIASYGGILQRVDGLSPRFIHLVRDPRGTVNSWTKRVRMKDDLDTTRYMPQYNSASGAIRYTAYNIEMHAVATKSPHLFMKYEDLIADPEACVQSVVSLFPKSARNLDLSNFIGSKRVKLGTTHTIAGNPMRHTCGWLSLQADEAWRETMPTAQQRLVSMLTYPLIRKYGYHNKKRLVL